MNKEAQDKCPQCKGSGTIPYRPPYICKDGGCDGNPCDKHCVPKTEPCPKCGGILKESSPEPLVTYTCPSCDEGEFVEDNNYTGLLIGLREGKEVFFRKAADVIEHLQARVEGLERENKKLKEGYRILLLKQDTLPKGE